MMVFARARGNKTSVNLKVPTADLTHLGDEEKALLADILHIWGALHDGFHSGQRQQEILSLKVPTADLPW